MSESDPFVEFPANTVIFREGDAGAEMYIIESGTVDILRNNRIDDPIANLGPGDFFGEMAILEDQPRFATARTTSDTRLMRIDRAAFADLISSNVEVSIRIMRKLTARLRRAELRIQELGDIINRGPPVPIPKVAGAANTNLELLQTPMPPIRVPKGGLPQTAEALAAYGPLVLVHEISKTRYPLRDRVEFLVGRPDPVTSSSPEVNLGPVDTNRSMSRRHAKIIFTGGHFKVREEVGTLNGTYLNGQRLRPGQEAVFKVGDHLRFGMVDLLVEADA